LAHFPTCRKFGLVLVGDLSLRWLANKQHTRWV